MATRRQASRHLVHDGDDLLHDVTPVAAARAFEQVADRGADLCLGVVFAVEVKLIRHDSTSCLHDAYRGRTEREELLDRALACDLAAKVNAWVTSPGLQAPKRWPRRWSVGRGRPFQPCKN